MTLREIQSALEKLDLSNPMFFLNEPQSTAIKLILFRARMLQLNSIPFFEKEKKILLESVLFQTVSDQLNHNLGELIRLHRTAESIRLGAEALKSALVSLLPPPDERTVLVKLPDAQDMEEAIESLVTIQRVFGANLINSKINGQIVVKSWQPGSLWLDVYLGSAAAVMLVGGMTWSAAVVRKKQAEARMFEKIADGMEIKNQMLDGIRKGVEDHIKMVIESEARILAAHNFGDIDDHEQIERLKMGVKDLAALIERGAQIHPALTAPEDVKNLFPDFAKLDFIESKQKLLKEQNPSPDKSS